MDCEHDYLFVVSGWGVGQDMVSEKVFVCSKCGQFTVQILKNGTVANITFRLTTPGLVKAAGQYVNHLKSVGVEFAPEIEG